MTGKTFRRRTNETGDFLDRFEVRKEQTQNKRKKFAKAGKPDDLTFIEIVKKEGKTEKREREKLFEEQF